MKIIRLLQRWGFICLFFATGFCQVCMAHDCCPKTNCVEEGGVEKRETRHVDSFNSIDIKGSFVSNITCNKNHAIEIICDKNLLPYISTEVRNQKLFIFPKKSICATKDIKIYISTSDIVKLDVSGLNDISITGIDNQNISIRLDGAGDMNISGNTEKFTAVISGSNGLNAKNLRSESTHISIAGSSNALVYASNALEADISGVGDIVYYGNPKTIRKNISGIGEIKNEK